uniref:Uncharacterized protein n=2 Tax=viral metagenome TaxID=1070528 RepID=A0A6M3LD17_9ZZZZ
MECKLCRDTGWLFDAKDRRGIVTMEEKSLRYRVNVSTSVKGIKTWDCTVDGQGFTKEEILAESDKLVEALVTRYPAPTE